MKDLSRWGYNSVAEMIAVTSTDLCTFVRYDVCEKVLCSKQDRFTSLRGIRELSFNLSSSSLLPWGGIHYQVFQERRCFQGGRLGLGNTGAHLLLKKNADRFFIEGMFSGTRLNMRQLLNTCLTSRPRDVATYTAGDLVQFRL